MENLVVSDDGIVTFKIINNANVPQTQVKMLEEEISNAYKVIQQSIKTDYIPSNEIEIILFPGKDYSWGFRDKIKLYGVRYGKYPLVHEMTHTLLGYGDNFDVSRGFLTQEGFGVYMENKWGKDNFPAHKMMKYFIGKSKTIPLKKLTDRETDVEFFRPAGPNPRANFALMQLSYYQAGSFVTHLIDKYGLEKFEKIFNKDSLEERLHEVYGKNVNELEAEWLAYIEKNYTEPGTDEKMKIENFYSLESIIDSLDHEYFEKE
ncbi:hypothetical protein [Bacillus sp. B-jedd]|uniref:hypothetical protein n=1 Tax=Bacillus sp. B-jedd TaxID=1476857 RepID=UPI0011DD021C|nr:hypothetical protein [Bacillus sp. B-jedd]